MAAAAGLLSVRRALLMDPAAGVTDRDIATWLGRGEFLRAQGVSSSSAANLSHHDRLCLRLVEMDSIKGAHAQMLAGEAMLRILSSKEPRAMGAQVKLIAHLQETFGEDAGGASKGAGIPQEDMDLLSADELEAVERAMQIKREQQQTIDTIVKTAKLRSVTVSPPGGAGGATLH